MSVIEREQTEDTGSYRSNFDRFLRGIAGFLSEENPLPTTPEKQSVVLSDLHSNALALDALSAFARQNTVFFVGDFALQGNDAESSLLAEQVAQIGDRVIAVSGNHDSKDLMLDLAKAGVVVLGEEGVLRPGGSWEQTAVRWEGMLVAGYRDPLEWREDDADNPGRIFSFSEMDPARLEQEEGRLLRWWRSLVEKPDILLLHQQELALFLAEKIKSKQDLTILTGHTHNPALLRIGRVSIVNPGSAGAGGLFGVGSEEGEAARLHFTENLSFVDFIAVDPLRGSARAERINARSVCQKSCVYEPNWGEIVRLGQ